MAFWLASCVLSLLHCSSRMYGKVFPSSPWTSRIQLSLSLRYFYSCSILPSLLASFSTLHFKAWPSLTLHGIHTITSLWCWQLRITQMSFYWPMMKHGTLCYSSSFSLWLECFICQVSYSPSYLITTKSELRSWVNLRLRKGCSTSRCFMISLTLMNWGIWLTSKREISFSKSLNWTLIRSPSAKLLCKSSRLWTLSTTKLWRKSVYLTSLKSVASKLSLNLMPSKGDYKEP